MGWGKGRSEQWLRVGLEDFHHLVRRVCWGLIAQAENKRCCAWFRRPSHKFIKSEKVWVHSREHLSLLRYKLYYYPCSTEDSNAFQSPFVWLYSDALGSSKQFGALISGPPDAAKVFTGTNRWSFWLTQSVSQSMRWLRTSTLEVGPTVPGCRAWKFRWLICVGGRLNYCSQCKSGKHSVILLGSHPTTSA